MALMIRQIDREEQARDINRITRGEVRIRNNTDFSRRLPVVANFMNWGMNVPERNPIGDEPRKPKPTGPNPTVEKIMVAGGLVLLSLMILRGAVRLIDPPEHLKESSMLAEIARENPDEEIRRKAVMDLLSRSSVHKANNQIAHMQNNLGKASNESDKYEAYITALRDVAMKSPFKETRLLAVNELIENLDPVYHTSDLIALIEVAKSSKFEDTKRIAIEKLHGRGISLE